VDQTRIAFGFWPAQCLVPSSLHSVIAFPCQLLATLALTQAIDHGQPAAYYVNLMRGEQEAMSMLDDAPLQQAVMFDPDALEPPALADHRMALEDACSSSSESEMDQEGAPIVDDGDWAQATSTAGLDATPSDVEMHARSRGSSASSRSSAQGEGSGASSREAAPAGSGEQRYMRAVDVDFGSEDNLTHRFGPFLFSHIVSKGYDSWLVTCPFHMEPGRRQTRQCRKTSKWVKGLDHEEVLRRLQAWCLAGRRHKLRGDRAAKQGHVYVDIKKLRVEHDRDLHQELAQALAEPQWILPAAEGSMSDSSSSSSDSSDSSSSS
jgi:hypothetical protein